MKKNQMRINDHIAVIRFDPDIGLFRGEFVGLNGGADFYAASVEELQREGEKSLDTYLSVCRERGIEPYRHFSGRFVARLSPDLHQRITLAAEAAGLSLNQWVQQALEREVA